MSPWGTSEGRKTLGGSLAFSTERFSEFFNKFVAFWIGAAAHDDHLCGDWNYSARISDSGVADGRLAATEIARYLGVSSRTRADRNRRRGCVRLVETLTPAGTGRRSVRAGRSQQ